MDQLATKTMSQFDHYRISYWIKNEFRNDVYDDVAIRFEIRLKNDGLV